MNDTLITTSKAIVFETSQIGTFYVEVIDKNCSFKIGPINLKPTKNVDIRMSTDAMTICENVASSSYISGSTTLYSYEKNYQWQKDGKDLPGEKNFYIYPSSSGIYALRLTAGNCSATSTPVIVKASHDNKIEDYIYNSNGISESLEDSVLLCTGNSYKFSAASGKTNWYRSGQLLINSDTLSIKEPGDYYIRREIAKNCFLESKPVNVSFGQTIKPIKFIDSLHTRVSCNTRYVHFNDLNLTGTNQLRFTDVATGSSFSFLNLHNYYVLVVSTGKYYIDYETGNCKSPTSIIDVKLKMPIRNEKGEPMPKKISVCANSIVRLTIDSFGNDELILYRNDTPIQSRPSNGKYVDFQATEKGKYYFKIIKANCNPEQTYVSDTVEIDMPDFVSTTLEPITVNCAEGKFQINAKEYPEYTYSWYKNDQLIPDEKSAKLTAINNAFGSYHAVIQKGLCAVTSSKTYIGEKIKGTSTVCQNKPIILSSSIAEGSYLWKGPNNFSSDKATISIDSANTKHAGLYILQTTKDGCTFTDSLQVKVPTRPNVSISFLNPMCVNKELLLDIKGAEKGAYIMFKFYGSPIVGTSISSAPGKVYSLRNLGTLSSLPENPEKEYMVIESQGCLFPVPVPARLSEEACQDLLEFVNVKTNYCVKENTSLEIRIPQNIPVGTKFNLRLLSSHDTFNLGSLSGNKIAVQIPDVSYSYENYFILESEDGKYKAFSKVFNVSNIRPSIYYDAGDYSTSEAKHCKGYAVKFEASNASYQKLQWRKDGLDLPGANKTTLEAVEDGYYSLVASYNGCTAESWNIRLTSGDLPTPYVNSVIGNNRACQGFAVPLRDDQGFYYPTYEWKLNGKIIETKDKKDIFEAKETGYYSLTGRQGNCESTSDSVFIEIGQSLNNVINGSGEGLIEGNKIILCDSLSFNLFSAHYQPQYQYENILQNHGLSFQWKLDNKNIPEATTTSFNSTKAGKYRLQIKQGDCISNSNEIEVVNQNPTHINLLSYYDDYTANGYHDGKPLGTITICNSDTIRINTPYNNGYSSWNKDLYKDGKLINTRTAENNQNWNNNYSLREPGKYALKLYSSKRPSCFVLSDTLTLQVTDKPIIWPIDSIYSCNDVIGMHTQSLGFKYEWMYANKIISTDPFIETDRLGLHILKIHKSNTCYIEKGYLIERGLKPIINQYLPETWSSLICANDKLSLSLGNLNDLEFGYDPQFVLEWYRDQQKLPYTDRYIEANQAGNYFAKVKYKECEAVSNVIKLEVKQVKNQISPLVDSLGICINGGFQILNASKEAGYIYEWFKDNVGLTESSSTLKATQPGIYKAFIQSGDCSALTPKVKVYPSTQLPTATISGDTTINFGDTVNLRLSFTSSPPFIYKLNNNQEGTSETPERIHPVKIEENYIYKLISVKNACGEGTVSGEAKINVIILGNEPLIGHKIIIAPVPAESYCEIIIDLPTSQEVSYQLLNMKGQQLSEKNLGNITYNKQYLNLNHLTAGEYLIRIQVGKDFVTRKLIKF